MSERKDIEIAFANGVYESMNNRTIQEYNGLVSNLALAKEENTLCEHRFINNSGQDEILNINPDNVLYVKYR